MAVTQSLPTVVVFLRGKKKKRGHIKSSDHLNVSTNSEPDLAISNLVPLCVYVWQCMYCHGCPEVIQVQKKFELLPFQI